jgi:hypothetical protein
MMLSKSSLLFLVGCAILPACGSETSPGGGGDAGDDGTNGAGGQNGRTNGGGVTNTGGGSTAGEPGGSDGGAQNGDGGSCAVVSTGVSLLPVHLAFAFDVSGSMGKGDEPYHDKTLKWDPVVKATRAFFQSQKSTGLTASLTFFPEDGDEDERCAEAAYTSPDVPVTTLPSMAFGEAIDEIEPQSAKDWRGGTPTVAVMRGTRKQLTTIKDSQPGHYAIVLVTDGYPQGCNDDLDDVERVVDEARAALGEGSTTYVIGVANPPVSGAPDTVSDLERIAKAGGTEKAFLIDTGDPESTAAAFDAAVNAIRSATLSCNIAIPERGDGMPFDKRKVQVHFESDGTSKDFAYDPNCANADSWHYDDPANPSAIVLCPQTCSEVQSATNADLEVRFACEPVLVL